MNDPRLEEIGAHLRAAAARRRSRRRLTSAAVVLLVSTAGVVGAGIVAQAQAARVVKETYAATTRVPAGTKTMLHVVTELEHEGEI
jgi:rhamnose utilization protein RhaD (predicted bifunctional aldolase and dehydrogenase)